MAKKVAATNVLIAMRSIARQFNNCSIDIARAQVQLLIIIDRRVLRTYNLKRYFFHFSATQGVAPVTERSVLFRAIRKVHMKFRRAIK